MAQLAPRLHADRHRGIDCWLAVGLSRCQKTGMDQVDCDAVYYPGPLDRISLYVFRVRLLLGRNRAALPRTVKCRADRYRRAKTAVVDVRRRYRTSSAGPHPRTVIFQNRPAV